MAEDLQEGKKATFTNAPDLRGSGLDGAVREVPEDAQHSADQKLGDALTDTREAGLDAGDPSTYGKYGNPRDSVESARDLAYDPEIRAAHEAHAAALKTVREKAIDDPSDPDYLAAIDARAARNATMPFEREQAARDQGAADRAKAARKENRWYNRALSAVGLRKPKG